MAAVIALAFFNNKTLQNAMEEVTTGVVHKLCDHFWGSIGHSDYFNIEMAAA